MLARVVMGRATPLEIVASVTILLVVIVVVARATIRIYTAGVILYGQRPSLRTFIAAARRPQ
jgi:hypothetical protein